MLCQCGCGQVVTEGCRFKRGHNSKVMSSETKQKISVGMVRVHQDVSVRKKHSEAMCSFWESKHVQDTLVSRSIPLNLVHKVVTYIKAILHKVVVKIKGDKVHGKRK